MCTVIGGPELEVFLSMKMYICPCK